MRKGMVLVFLVLILCSFLAAQETEGIKIGNTTWTFNGEIRFMYTDQTDPMYYNLFYAATKAPMYSDIDGFNRMYQRYRFGVTGALSDRLSAHFQLQVGDEQWGNKNYNEREVNIKTLYAYLQFAPEFLGDNTSIRVGLQPYDDIFQYSIYSDEAVGVLINHANDTFSANLGYFTLRDDDVDNDWDAAEDGDYYIWPLSETLFVFDMNYKATDALNVKGAFYYDSIPKAYTDIDDDEYFKYNMAFFGAGFDYLMNENMSFGGHFVMRSGKLESYDEGDLEFEIEGNGWFAYAYTTYTMDKFSAKLNFGYTPFDFEENEDHSVSLTTWSGAFPLVDYGFAVDDMFLFINGNQWQTAYGLEYFGRGDVCDRQAVNGGYGGYGGLMVVSANLSYDFLFANFGIMNHTFSNETFPSDFSKSIGTELDLGVKTNIMEGLEFKAVYAMFFVGDFYTFGGSEDVDNAHEMSMQLRYAF